MLEPNFEEADGLGISSVWTIQHEKILVATKIRLCVLSYLVALENNSSGRSVMYKSCSEFILTLSSKLST